jgi:hypothetical protein
LEERGPRWTLVFTAAAVGFALAAVHHGVAAMVPGWGEPSPTWRHALFVAVNLGVAAGLWFRPRFFAVLFALLTLQQLYSPGTYGWHVLLDEGRIDGSSVLVLMALPVLAGLLGWDAMRRRT